MLVTAKVSKNDGLLTFVAEHSCSKHKALVAGTMESPYLWHRRPKHASFDVLAQMQSQKLVSGVNVSAAEFRAAKTRTVCEPCELGKQTRGTHPTSDSVSPAPLDMLHIDVLEMPVLSRQHFKHLLGVVDDHSRLACVAGLKTKGAAADNLRALILRLEKQRERQVKVVRSDMGREFLGGDLQGWLRERGIEHQTTAGYSSQ
jgi:transposase InsO family protein